ncbi:MAG: transketolase family protein [Armatimonadota bacterium]
MDDALPIGRPNMEEFAGALLELAQQDPDVLVVTSDSRGSGRLNGFAEALPKQMIEVGIAEQTLVGVAAGLASTGKKVFAVSPASFLTARALEQIKNDVAYSDHPVKLVGISAGVSYGALGSTHHSLHDFAALRAIHNLDIVAPGDNFETRETIRAAVTHPRPLYIRFGKWALPRLHGSKADFEIGKAITVSDGSDVTFVGIGETVCVAYEAAVLLREEGIAARVISMHTLKPLDETTLLNAARETSAMVTVEEHSIHGGLGDACASVLLQHGAAVPFRIVGIPDEDTVTGHQRQVFEHYGITAEKLAGAATQMLSGGRME